MVDVGAGTGALAVPLAAHARRMIAVDVSGPMLAELEKRAADAGLANIQVHMTAIEQLDLPAASVDLVVSNYTLHHLLDRDKHVFIERAAEWLRPGGRLIIGDMMFGRGATASDRAIIGSKVKVMLSRGPGGWWRLIKNVWRFSLRLSERPVGLDEWTTMLVSAGLIHVRGSRVVAEAGVVCGRRRSACPLIAATL